VEHKLFPILQELLKQQLAEKPYQLNHF